MSFSHLATVGTLSYNGYTFDGASQVSVHVEFVNDDAGRTVIYHKHTITVRFMVNDTNGTDGDMQNIRARLSKQGQALRFLGHGFGDDLSVNYSGSGLRDVKWGPKPKILHWEPVGSDNTCEVIWEVETCVPVCNTSGVHRTTGIMALNYSVSFRIERGLTTRVIDGYLEIAQTRLLASTPDCADMYRHYINPFLPLEFERVDSDWRVSLDKSRLEFSITDRQIPSRNAYPDHVTKIDAEHRVSWVRGNKGGMHLRNTITANIELGRTVQNQHISPSYAWQIFGTLVRQRIDYARAQNKFVMLEEVIASEELFGPGHSFSASYRMLMSVGEIFDFGKSGIWQPVGGTDWGRWRTSMARMYDNRGVAGLTQLPAGDAIIDLCVSSPSINWNAGNPAPPPPTPTQTPTFQNQRPPANQSYLKLKMQTIVNGRSPVVRQAIMQAPPQTQTPNQTIHSTDGANFGAAGGVDDILQAAGRVRNAVVLVGSALRAGYEIPRPGLVSVGTQTPVEVAGQFASDTAGIFFGLPVYRASWALLYDLPNSPGTVHPLPNMEN
ncbi:MAG: hypothetical protein WD872_17640 [Pirellulaceae bacterium]